MSTTCDAVDGQCRCITNVVGLTCDKCKDGYWGVPANCTGTFKRFVFLHSGRR